jgi:branched-chain amino acid transport system permease protein
VFNTLPGDFGLDFDTTQITFAIYGFLLVIMMIMRPEGLIPERRRKQELHEAEGEEAVVSTTV